MIETASEIERVILIALITANDKEFTIQSYLEELELLVDTAGGETIKRFIQKLERQDSRTYLGSGKIAEIRDFVKENDIDTAIFDDALSPSQQRNIENAIGCKILDRNTLILDIFAKRAKTAHAKTQVELAQYQYMLPRLTRLWTHLTKMKGGIGLRGPGETELETDRRIIRNKIALLKEKLVRIDRQKETQRQSRGKLVRVSLVGYTNVGKSTLMNLLSKSEVFAENKLFATLDTTVRKVVIENLPFLLSDTVGFLRKLPHDLIESFKSTLDEVRESDLLLHVVDISHPEFEEQIHIVQQTLQEIGAADKPVIYIFNKIDAYNPAPRDDDDLSPLKQDQLTLEELKNSWMAGENTPSLFISAFLKTNIPQLKQMLYEEVKRIHIQRYPYNDFLF